MWLVKLPFRILALPIMAIVAVLSIFYSLALNLSAMVAGLVYLVLGICIVMLLFQHAWIYAAPCHVCHGSKIRSQEARDLGCSYSLSRPRGM